MKRKILLILIILLSISHLNAQTFPKIEESVRIKRLEPPIGKIRMVLDTDTYNEIDDQYALSYAYLSKDKLQLEAVYAAPFFNSRAKSAGDGMEKSYEGYFVFWHYWENLLKALLTGGPKGISKISQNRFEAMLHSTL